MKIELKDKTREQLLDIYENKLLASPDEILTLHRQQDVELVRREVQKQLDIVNKSKEQTERLLSLSDSELQALCEKIGVEDFTDEDIKTRSRKLISDIAFKENIYNLSKQMENMRLSSDLRNDSEDTDIREDLARLKLIRESKEPEMDSDQWIDQQNIKTSFENKVRAQYGLKPKNLILTDSDIITLLDLDNGESLQEFIDMQTDPAYKKELEQRSKEILNVRELEDSREQREKDYLFSIEKEFKYLSDHRPEKYVVIDSNPDTYTQRVSNQWIAYKERVERLWRKLQNKARGYEATGSPVPDTFTEIFKGTEKLIKKIEKE